MKFCLSALFILTILLSCNDNKPEEVLDLEGTWQLISGTIIEKGDSVFTDYTSKNRMIKIINKTHFAFLNHDENKGKDSTAMFSAGGGRYELKGDRYTEYLDYCSDRAWEGNTFLFTVAIRNDTLTQTGMETIEATKVNRMNIEKYVRVQK
jgi:hypothetical protein